jgi:hypothetical protein
MRITSCTLSRPQIRSASPNIHRRHHEKPSGVYWGQVTDETFHRVTVHFAPPQSEEGFRVLTHVHDMRQTVGPTG